MNRPTLDQLAIKYGTDKSSEDHNYTPYYSAMFEPRRDLPLTIAEIGVWEGASLMMWEEYFPNATVVGLDIEEKTECDGGRVKTVICDQSSNESLLSFFRYNPVDIIIVDGSHKSRHDILTFLTAFPFLNAGGLYINEDLLCDYRPTYNEGVSSIQFYKDLVNNVMMGGKTAMKGHISSDKRKVRLERTDLTLLEETIESISFNCGMVTIKKF